MAANEACCAGGFLAAQDHFELAMRLARRLFQEAVEAGFCPLRATDILLVARQNLAGNLMRAGRAAEACTELETACRALADWRHAPHAPVALRAACDERLPFALHVCVAQLERCGAGPERIAAIHARTCRPPPFVPAS